jgi:hypothetical protein
MIAVLRFLIICGLLAVFGVLAAVVLWLFG